MACVYTRSDCWDRVTTDHPWNCGAAACQQTLLGLRPITTFQEAQSQVHRRIVPGRPICPASQKQPAGDILGALEEISGRRRKR
jgi:hypothetical protein